MIPISVLLTSLLFLTKPTSSEASFAPHDLCDAENISWQGGEEVTYKIFYQLNFIWIPAGQAKFKVRDLGDRYHVSIVGKTISAFEWFYEVNDHYESVIDKKTLLPISFSRNIQEGKYVWWDKFTFDHKNRKVHGIKGWPDKATKYYQSDVSGCVHDMISIVYNIRNADFDKYKPGHQFDINVFVEEEYPLKVELRSKDLEVKVRGMGVHKTHLIRPQVVSGHFFNEDTRMDIYMSADNNRIPLMIESPVSVGKIKAVLQSHKGLKYPLTACN